MLVDCRKREKEGERERNIHVRDINLLPLARVGTSDRTSNLGMYPDQESNPSVHGMALQPNEPHQLGLIRFVLNRPP